MKRRLKYAGIYVALASCVFGLVVCTGCAAVQVQGVDTETPPNAETLDAGTVILAVLAGLLLAGLTLAATSP